MKRMEARKMNNFFSTDSKFMVALSRLTDLILLNLLFLITSIPIFTVGASATALYTVASKVGTDQEAGVFGPYFRAFRGAFKQGTILWLIILGVGAAIAMDAFLVFRMSGPVRYAGGMFLALLALLAMSAGYVFPLISQFENGNLTTIKNAILLAVGYLPRSIAMAVLNLLPAAAFLIAPAAFFQAAFLWAFLYFAAAAYFDGLILRKVFAPYLTGDEKENEEAGV